VEACLFLLDKHAESRVAASTLSLAPVSLVALLEASTLLSAAAPPVLVVRFLF
jgi:hypothetical protein